MSNVCQYHIRQLTTKFIVYVYDAPKLDLKLFKFPVLYYLHLTTIFELTVLSSRFLSRRIYLILRGSQNYHKKY